MSKLQPLPIPRRQLIRLGLLAAAGIAIAACAPQQSSAPGSRQQEWQRQREKRIRMGEGHDNASMR